VRFGAVLAACFRMAFLGDALRIVRAPVGFFVFALLFFFVAVFFTMTSSL
jgi:hypothetical protein